MVAAVAREEEAVILDRFRPGRQRLGRAAAEIAG
jgi:hypothetical protein